MIDSGKHNPRNETTRSALHTLAGLSLLGAMSSAGRPRSKHGPFPMVEHFFAAELLLTDVPTSPAPLKTRASSAASVSSIMNKPSKPYTVRHRLVYPEMGEGMDEMSNPSDLILLFCLPSLTVNRLKPLIHDFVLTNELGLKLYGPPLALARGRMLNFAPGMDLAFRRRRCT